MPNSISDNLDRFYKYMSAQEGIKELIIGLSDYVKYIEETPELKKITDGWLSKKDIIYKELSSLEEKTVKELLNSKKQIERTVDNVPGLRDKIKRDGFFGDGLTAVDQYLNSRLFTSGIVSDVIGKYLHDTGYVLTEDGYGDILKDFIEKKRSGGRIISFSKKLEERRSLSGEFNRQRQIEIWGNWDYISLAPDFLHLLDTIYLKKLKEIPNLDLDLTKFHNEIIFILNRPTEVKREVIERLKRYATRVHNQLLKEVSERNNSDLPGATATMVWVSKDRSGKYNFDGNPVYIKNKDAQYAVIFDIAYDLKPLGGKIKYQEIIDGCLKRGKRVTKISIQRALTGNDANFFKYVTSIRRVLQYGIPLFSAMGNGKEIEFNNKK